MNPRTHARIRYFRVGGLRFLRVYRLQLSWCVVRRTTSHYSVTECGARRAT
jgi:hypothetical protein